MFDQFSHKSIRVVLLAQEESRRAGHQKVGTEHLLLGLIGEGTSIASKFLKIKDINLAFARITVEELVGRGSGSSSSEFNYTSRWKLVLDRAILQNVLQNLEGFWINV